MYYKENVVNRKTQQTMFYIEYIATLAPDNKRYISSFPHKLHSCFKNAITGSLRLR